MSFDSQYRYPVRHLEGSLSPAVLSKYLKYLYIETGTNIGNGIRTALSCGCKHIISIELDTNLFTEAEREFKGNDRVTLLCGDSALALGGFMPTVLSPVTIFLDANSAEQNPLLEELEAIALSPCKEHTILIDDVRMFGHPEWHGIDELAIVTKLYKINPDYELSYEPTPNGERDLLVARVPE